MATVMARPEAMSSDESAYSLTARRAEDTAGTVTDATDAPIGPAKRLFADSPMNGLEDCTAYAKQLRDVAPRFVLGAARFAVPR